MATKRTASAKTAKKRTARAAARKQRPSPPPDDLAAIFKAAKFTETTSEISGMFGHRTFNGKKVGKWILHATSFRPGRDYAAQVALNRVHQPGGPEYGTKHCFVTIEALARELAAAVDDLHRAIAVSYAIGKATVCDYLERADKAALTWLQAQGLSDVEIESRLFRHVGRNEPSVRAPIDFGWVHRELRRTGVTLQLLWLEYQESTTQRGGEARAYQYSQFCELYASFRDRLEPPMR